MNGWIVLLGLLIFFVGCAMHLYAKVVLVPLLPGTEEMADVFSEQYTGPKPEWSVEYGCYYLETVTVYPYRQNDWIVMLIGFVTMVIGLAMKGSEKEEETKQDVEDWVKSRVG